MCSLYSFKKKIYGLTRDTIYEYLLLYSKCVKWKIIFKYIYTIYM